MRWVQKVVYYWEMMKIVEVLQILYHLSNQNECIGCAYTKPSNNLTKYGRNLTSSFRYNAPTRPCGRTETIIVSLRPFAAGYKNLLLEKFNMLVDYGGHRRGCLSIHYICLLSLFYTSTISSEPRRTAASACFWRKKNIKSEILLSW